MQIEKIIYETTRSVSSLEDKLRIATIFIFCYKLGAKEFAELLYTNNHERFINKLEKKYQHFNISLAIEFSDKNVKSCFYKTLNKVKEKYDDDKYYKAIFEDDPFAIAIQEIVNFTFDIAEFKNHMQSVQEDF